LEREGAKAAKSTKREEHEVVSGARPSCFVVFAELRDFVLQDTALRRSQTGWEQETHSMKRFANLYPTLTSPARTRRSI